MSSFFSPGTDLLTARLLLRPWPAGEVAAVLGDVRFEHWADDFPADGDRAVAGFINENPGCRTEYGRRQIVERAGGLVVGSIGVFWPPEDGAVEFGYGVVASRRGSGYATEAARAVVRSALSEPELHTVRANAELSNPASVRVLEKAGPELYDGDATVVRYRAVAPDRAQTRR